MASLEQKVRSEANLFAAWRHVRRSALNSADDEIKGFAAEFEHQHQRHIRRIIDQLREHRFEFDPYKGVLKDKKKRANLGKDPRPIAIGTIKNRVVQRAILQILQPRNIVDEKNIDSRYTPVDDPNLGRLNQVNRSKFGVGGLLKPYGGVEPAISKILEAMSNGALYYYQSDIKSFFTKIPTKPVINKIREQTKDDNLTDLFSKGLEVHLSNKKEIIKYSNLFPSGGIGVAQGSSLSAFAGNVLLYDFDHQLNDLEVTAIRYIDDLVIVAESRPLLDKAISFSKNRLGGFGFSLYEPSKGSDKAASGKCENSFKFLGCTLQPNRCVPSKNAIQRLMNEIRKEISKSKRLIAIAIDSGKPLKTTASQSAVVQRVGRKVFGWQKAFKFCTDTGEFRIVDKKIADMVFEYERWVRSRTKKLSISKFADILGVPNTFELHTKRNS